MADEARDPGDVCGEPGEMLFRRLFARLPESFALGEMLYNEDGRPVDWRILDGNDAYVASLGMARGDLIGRRALELFAPEVPEFMPHLAKVVATGVPDSYETFLERLNRYLRIITIPAGGACFAVLYTDISAHKATEDALREANRQLHIDTRIIENSPDAVLVLDLAGRILAVNPAFAAWMDLPAEAIPGNAAEALMGTEEYRRVIYPHLARAFAGEMIEYEKWYDFPTGRRYLNVRYYPIQAPGEEGCIAVALRDMTAHKETEDALHAHDALLQAFIEHVPAAVAMFDREMRYIAVSRRWLADYRLGERNIIGLSHYEVFPEIGERWKAIHRRTLTGVTARCEEDPFPRADGTLDWVKWEIVPWWQPDGSVGGITMFTEVITARKRAEEALRESEERLRAQLAEVDAIYKYVPVGLFMVDRDLRFLRINAQLAEINGLPIEAHLGHTISELVPELSAQLGNYFRPVFERGETVLNVEVQGGVLSDPGMAHVFLANYFPFKSESGEVVALLGAVMDITERKHTEEALRESEANLRRAEGMAQLGYWEWEPRTDTVHWSEGIFRVFGQPPRTDLHITDLYAALHPDDRPRMEQVVMDALQGPDRSIVVDYRIVRPDGAVRTLHAEGEMTLDAAGAPERFFGIQQDITERKQAEEALRESEANLRRAEEIAQVGYWEWYPRTNSVHGSEGAIRVFGFPLGKKLHIVDILAAIHPDDRPRIEQIIADAQRGGETPSAADFRIVRPDGAVRALHMEGQLTLDAAGKSEKFFGILQDITERKHMENALRESEANLKHAEAMAQLGYWEWHPRTDTAHWSEGTFRIFGQPPRPVLHLADLITVLHPDDRADVERIIVDALRDRRPFTCDYRILRPDGAVRMLHSEAELSLDAAGEPEKFFGILQDITERKQAEDALRKSEERFRTLVESTSDFVWEVDARGVYTYASPKITELLGYTPEEILGKTPFDLMPPEEAARVETIFRDCLASPHPIVALENLNIHKDGRRVVLESSGVPIVDADGRAQGFRGIDRDITERKRAEEALREREATIRSIFSAAPIGIGMLVNRVFREVNDQLLTMTGYTRDELIGRSARLVYATQEEFERVGQVKYALIRERGTGSIETRWQRKDGAMLDILLSSTPLDPTDLTAGVTFTALDITARKQAEAERERLLGEVERRAAELDAVITAAADGVMIYGPHSEITRMNPAAERIFGYTPAERHLPLAERLAIVRPETPAGQPITLEEFPTWRALHGETMQGHILVLQHPGGTEYWVSVSAAPLRDAAGDITGAVVTITDISALHELQQERDIFMHTISHDLRNPLSVIQGHARLCESAIKAKGLNGELLVGVQAILRSTSRMTVMLEDLVDAARREGGEITLRREPVALDEFLVDLLQRSETALEVGRVQLALPADLPRMDADPARLERILLNLLTNALKYSPEDSAVRITARRTDDMVEVAVIDEGVGIDPEDLPHIFERFYRPRGPRAAERIGLGLYITRILVEAHGGHIRVDSAPGTGSTFTFTLPSHSA